MKLKKSICKRLLVCMRMTIGMGVKPLFVSYANHYSFVHRTTIGLSANDYCTEPYPNSFTPRLRSNHPSISSQKGKLKRNSILNISHLYINKACADMP